MPYKLLICDINIRASGHYLGYSQYLIDNIFKLFEGLDTVPDVTFSFNLSGKDLLTLPVDSKLKFHFFDVPSKSDKSTFELIRIWDLIRKYGTENQINELIFMDLDQYQIPIGLFKNNFLISGIYFRPHHRILRGNGNVLKHLTTFTKRYKKILLEKILLRNKTAHRIFILNDEAGVKALNNYHQTDAFTFLADPIFSYKYAIDEISNEFSSLKNDSFKFLLFGAISERKNTTNIIIAFLNTSFSINTTLYIIGPISDDYHTYLTELILKHRDSAILNNEIVIINKFVSNAEMEYIHQSINVSLLIYKNFYGSSGLVGHAAKHHKFVIVSNLGLLNDLVMEFKLGIAVDANDIKSISKGLKFASYNYSLMPGRSAEFYSDHQPLRFLHGLINKY